MSAVPPSICSSLRLLLLCLSLMQLAARSQGQENFMQLTQNAPWSQRTLVYSTIVQIATGNVDYEPLLVGGLDATGTYNNDVWLGSALLSQGTWMQLPSAPFSGRAGGGMFNVLLSQAVQIVLVAGGRQAAGPEGLLNEIWYTTTNGAQWTQFPQDKIEWSARELFGFVIAQGFDDTSTVYGYALGGNTANGPVSDLYYSKGRGTTNPWERVPAAFGGTPEWTPRYAFGCAPNSGGQGIVIAGGILASGDFTNEVWIWNLGSAWTMVSAVPTTSAYVNLVKTTSSNFYILGALLNTPGNPQIDPEVFESMNGITVFRGVGSTPQPLRYQASTPIDPRNIAYSLGGSTDPNAPAYTNDVWYIQLQ